MNDYDKLIFGSFSGLLRIELGQPFRKGCEYLRHLEKDDVVEWCRFIEGVLPRIDEIIASLRDC